MLTRYWASLGFAAIAAVALAPGVIAAPPPPPPPPPGHHPLPPPPATKAEAEAQARRMFAAADTAHDGYVTRAEADAGRQRLRAMMAERMKAGRGQRFDRLDANRDGTLSRSEFAAARPGPAMAPADISGGRERVSREMVPPPPPPPHGGRMPPPPPRGADPHARMTIGVMFDRMDSDHDDRVSLAEATAMADHHFAMRGHRRLMLKRDGDPKPMPRPMERAPG